MEPELRVRLNQLDWTLNAPTAFDNAPPNIALVPVIRVFGPTSSGVQACVHIHQVYPYFYVDYPDSLEPDVVLRYITLLQQTLNSALAVSARRDRTETQNTSFIRKILLVKGVHFYGFSNTYSPFLKLYFVDPQRVTRAATLMRSGSILGTRFRVYDGHLGFILQFMADFGLYGCSWLEVSECRRRGHHPNTPPSNLSVLPEVSRLQIEVDVVAPHIMNRRYLKERDIHHYTSPWPEQTASEPAIQSVRELWEEERQRRVLHGLPSDLQPLSDGHTRAPRSPWTFEREFRGRLAERIAEDSGNLPEQQPIDKWEGWIQTAFVSTECLWTVPFRSWKPATKEGNCLNPEENPYRELLDTDIIQDDNVTIVLDEEAIMNISEDAQEEDEPPEDELLDPSSARLDDEDDFFQLRAGDEDAKFSDQEDQNAEEMDDEDSLNLLDEQHGVELDPPEQGDQSHLAGTTPQSSLPLDPRQQTLTDSQYWALTINGTATQSQRSAAEVDDPGPVGFFQQDAEILPEFGSGSPTTVHDIPVGLANEEGHPDTTDTPSSIGHAYRFAAPKRKILQAHVRENPRYFGVEYLDPYYSNADDYDGVRCFGGLWYDVRAGQAIANLDQWSPLTSLDVSLVTDGSLVQLSGWQYFEGEMPPVKGEARRWLEQETSDSSEGAGFQKNKTSDGDGEDKRSTFTSPTRPQVALQHMSMSILSLEICSPSSQTPASSHHAAALLSYVYQPPAEDLIDTRASYRRGYIAIAPANPAHGSLQIRGVPVQFVESEVDLLQLVAEVTLDLDPDVLVGWEAQRSSWGYLRDRAELLGLDFQHMISRVFIPSSSNLRQEFLARKATDMAVAGRHILNLWKLMRGNMQLKSYTLENVAMQVLKKRLPKYDHGTLQRWHNEGSPWCIMKIMEYLSTRASCSLEIIEGREFITRSAEFARICGIDFYSVLIRGSQFKVESFMARIAKAENLMLLSPSKADVGKQNGAECMPLTVEPRAAFYKSPMLVLDFQSLYPSVMIAYNYCYSTCVGRIRKFQGCYKLGVLEEHPQPPGLLNSIKDNVSVSPNGIVYITEDSRRGLLGRMLRELLDTRVMIKDAMALWKSDKWLLRILDARQRSLKFVCNVTYGYTGASFSGRMPLVEIADDIVQSGREILESAMELIRQTPKWDAEVVYGDTDSLFVSLPGRSLKDAFDIGDEIAKAVTASNLAPIRLKFEKVYLPCVLMAKKRYVGFKLETVDQTEPEFDAKGIETIRRDGVPAQAKLVEKTLRILFKTRDLSKVKERCFSVWRKLLENRASVQDYVFAKEVKIGAYSENAPPQPGAAVALKMAEKDAHGQAFYGERVPYVISRGNYPGARLWERALPPEALLGANHGGRSLDAEYYITRVLIPPLERIFNLVGADVKAWYASMPRSYQLNSEIILRQVKVEETEPPRPKIAGCLVCGREPRSDGVFCNGCQHRPEESRFTVASHDRSSARRRETALRVCEICTESKPGEDIDCVSLDCEWLFERRSAQVDADKSHWAKRQQDMVLE